MLPPELLSMVCNHVPKKGLKTLRLVCKSYGQAAVSHVFDEIFMSFNMADLRIAKLVVIRFKQYIRTLVFSSVYYRVVPDGDFELHFQDAFPDDESTVHSDFAYQRYRDIRKKQQETLRSGACQTYLAFALSTMPRLKKIILTDWRSSRSMSTESMLRYDSRHIPFCPAEDCWLDAHEHFDFAPIRQSGLERTGPLNPWTTILLALSATSTYVPEITMETIKETEYVDYKALDASAFRLPPLALCEAKLCFAALTKLRLSLTIDPGNFTSGGRTSCVHRNLPKLLRAAVNLECLAIEVYGWDTVTGGTSSFNSILGRCKFLRLRSLILAFFDSTEQELLRLLKYSTDLAQLTLDGHTLTSGSWAGLINKLRAKFSLSDVELDQLFGGFAEPCEDTEFLDRGGTVEKFFLGKGPNPFTKEAIQRYEDERKSGRTLYQVAEGYRSRYHRFHK